MSTRSAKSPKKSPKVKSRARTPSKPKSPKRSPSKPKSTARSPSKPKSVKKSPRKSVKKSPRKSPKKALTSASMERLARHSYDGRVSQDVFDSMVELVTSDISTFMASLSHHMKADKKSTVTVEHVNKVINENALYKRAIKRKAHESSIPFATFDRLAKDVAHKHDSKLRFSKDSLEQLRHLVESLAAEVVTHSVKLMHHAKRTTLMASDVDLVAKIRS